MVAARPTMRHGLFRAAFCRGLCVARPRRCSSAQKGGRVAIYIFGHVSYSDVFDERHRTNFLQICRWDTKDNFGTVNLGRHNEAT